MSRIPALRLARHRNPPSGLPQPAIASGPRTNANGGAHTKRATFDEENFPGAMRVHWSRFKKRLGNGSNISESLLEISESNNGSESYSKRPHTTNAGSNADDTPNKEDEEVNEVVVDNCFAVDPANRSKSATQPSEHGGTPEKTGTSGTHGTHLTDTDSLHEHGWLWHILTFLTSIKYHAWVAFDRFFFTGFYDPASEAQYKKETYYQLKGLSLIGALVMIVNWILILILIAKPITVMADKIFYWGIAPVLTVPLVLMILFDWPKNRPWVYQIFMSISVWSWSAYSLLLLKFCGYYRPDKAVFNCHGKDFLTVFYYTSAFPVIGLFALGQNRLMGAITALLTAGMIASVIPDKSTWTRNLLNYILYISFILFIHFQRETAERRLYTMRDRLKVQYRATQKAQVREVRAADSKKRFSSYIFHEVRVPLNTALLAVQNMEASNLFDRENIEYIALEGSLNMMSKVLNDVLDFNRMDSGRFESVSKPYAFHKVVQGMLVPLQMASGARGLELITELDPRIDTAARTAMYKARGATDDEVAKKLLRECDGEDTGLIVGDEHRLRQVVTNLASNAAKFTPTGGKIYVRTMFLPDGFGSVDDAFNGPAAPANHLDDDDDDDDDEIEDPLDHFPKPGVDQEGLTGARLRMHNHQSPSVIRAAPPGHIVIRIEVEDTGVGIRRKDMVDNRLFSPYVQTDLGRFQGGKGTGLGLALSKHIVRLSGGRLGVKSKRGQGSIFWVEMAVGVGQQVFDLSNMNVKDGMVADSFRAVSETFKTPESEGGGTPSTAHDNSPKDGLFPPTAPPPNQAMRQVMEHSGQIELLPRMTHRLTDNSAMNSGGSTMTSTEGYGSSRPPSPAVVKRNSRGAMGLPSMTPAGGTGTGTVKPTGIAMPPPMVGWGDQIHVQKPTPSPQPATVNESPASLPKESPTAATKISISPAPLFDPPLEVLVVDDDGLTRKLMSRMLTRLGCNVETADNGKTAVDMALRAANPFTFSPPAHPYEVDEAKGGLRKVHTPYMQEEDPKYDVIFLDNQMPIMSGVDAVKKLRELKRKDFVVGVTGNALKEDQQEYLDAGVDAVLTKPVAETSLKNCLYAADEKRKARALVTAAASDGDVSVPPGSR